ncbi:hypothetical protein GCM10009661_56350 [Catellatospora chokoriensis]|uniref:Colicin immunity protein/pyocin immunity protein n=2 Tax=Catellatospora chokoriensis TaxID=310353 RepID=A0A8J3K590_9ACTN|nr:hypothetical protein Cch02nite_39570 [Catellatospora chokoriensis]
MVLDGAGRERALWLIGELRDPRLPDESADALLVELERLLAFPRITDLLFYENPELSDEEVIEKALGNRPIEL